MEKRKILIGEFSGNKKKVLIYKIRNKTITSGLLNNCLHQRLE